jgi:predicted flavoprotein YhiN
LLLLLFGFAMQFVCLFLLLMVVIENDSYPLGYNMAEVTGGGVPLNEISLSSMESKVCPGLYIVGELLDCFGRIGGFSFYWAWTTGAISGRALASLSKVRD